VQVADRLSAQAPATSVRTSRSTVEIVRANVLTFFNGLLGTLCVIVLMTGRWQNALFGAVVVVNAAFGIVQELRAKRTLDRLAVLNAPAVHVVRDGAEGTVPAGQVVVGDLVLLGAGDQVPVDGFVQSSTGLAIDESLLTGEAEPIGKEAGQQVLSGSIVVAGRGSVQAVAVGDSAYATRLAMEARRFTTTRSELVAETNRILRWIGVALVLVGPAVLWSQFRTEDNPSWREAVTGTVAALVGMVPEGLVLLTTLAFLIATVTLARQHVLVQELPAVEGLARVDVVCLDKTGTLTEGDVRFHRLVLLPEERPPAGVLADSIAEVLALFADADRANATATALRAAFPVPAATPPPVDVLPFSSVRKWSALRTGEDACSWILGAPEMALPDPSAGEETAARDAADRLAADGFRVLLLANTRQRWDRTADDVRLPRGLRPRALVVLAERIRDDAAEVLAYFTGQGVALKVISGDNPRTVGAVAAAVGVPTVTGAADAVDGRTLPEDLDALADVMDRHSAFGRVSPAQKRAMVAALQRRGHVVAMTGDGVNDALALKDADVGVAMGNGSAATRAVAQLVLLDGRFAHLPTAVAEGRRVIANVERAANLFLIKNVYSLVLALITVVTLVAYPLAPVQLTLISAVTIGIPGFFLALGPNPRRYLPGFLGRVLAFSVPAGVITGVAAYAGYAAVRRLDPASGLPGARTAAALVVIVVALWTLGILGRPLRAWKLWLLAAMATIIGVVLVVPAIGERLLLLRVTVAVMVVAAAVGTAGALLVEVAHRITTNRSRVGGP
jgi:cation-transporting ATPase E